MAKKYRASITKSYYDKKNKVKDLPKFFAEYYKPDTPIYKEYLQEQLTRKERKIGDRTIRHFEGFINNYFVPFLKETKIKRLNEINAVKIRDFQGYLVEKGLTPKTINTNINGSIKQVFTSLLLKGVIKEVPAIKNLPESDTRNKRHTLPIYETLKVLSDTELWKLYKTQDDIKAGKIANETHYKKYRLVCLLAATCGLRNAEIFMLRKENIIKIRGINFLDIVKSRDSNG